MPCATSTSRSSRRADRARRPLGVREDDAAARLLRAGAPLPRRRGGGRDRGRGPRRPRPRAGRAGRRRRAGRPGPGDAGRLDDRARRARAAARDARRAAGRAGARGRGGRAGAGDRRTCSTAPTDTLSGGELQRVALAAALVGRPRLVLLDEPTSQLDPVAGDELIGLLRRLNEEWGMAVVLAEHRLERCLAAADRVVAMVDGRIAFDGAPARLPATGRWRATPRSRRRRRGCSTSPGLRPPPVGVKAARRGAGGASASAAAGARAPGPDAEARRGGRARRRVDRAALEVARPVGRARRGRRAARRPARRRPGVEPRRAGRADGPKRRRQDARCCARPPGCVEPARGADRRRRAAALCCPRARPTCWSASGLTTSFPARRAAGRSRRSGSSGRPRPIRATSPAASASGWRSRS